jgi:hypothetical protein
LTVGIFQAIQVSLLARCVAISQCSQRGQHVSEDRLRRCRNGREHVPRRDGERGNVAPIGAASETRPTGFRDGGEISVPLIVPIWRAPSGVRVGSQVSRSDEHGQRANVPVRHGTSLEIGEMIAGIAVLGAFGAEVSAGRSGRD